MKRLCFSVWLLLLLLSCQQPPEAVQHDGITYLPMETKRLPDMNEPRSGHGLVWAGDHLLAVGGHTTGFIPSTTAEYFEGGSWHSLSTLYPHDTPFAIVLNDGDVLLGGGYESNFGVGRTWGVECYHPATRSFAPKPILDRKRAHASALELENGQIVISGNWYATDFTEIYNATDSTVWIDTASDNRSYPIILPVTKDNVWIIGGRVDSYNNTPTNIVDQLKGEPFSVDLLAEWHPQSPLDRNLRAAVCHVAENTFLIPAKNALGQYAPMLVDSSGFSLLPMEQPLPTEGPWGSISYRGSFWTSPETQTAWLLGVDELNHAFLAEIGYQTALQGGKAQLTMHYTPAIEELPNVPWEMLLPDGTFVIAGGLMTSNYAPSAMVCAFYPNTAPKQHASVLFIGIGLALLIGLFLAFVMRKRKLQKEENPAFLEETNSSKAKSELADKLKALMEEKQLFKNKDLRAADVAAELCTNTTYLSACLSGELNTTFPAFVTGYRIRYAQELMRHDPAMRMSQVAEESGFTNEKTFLRSFKSACGVTPSEWKVSAIQ